MSRTRALFSVLTAAAVALTMGACGSSDSSGSSGSSPSSTVFTTPGAKDKGGTDNPVVIGVVGASGKQWPVFTAAALAEGIHVKLVDFTDYQQPNPALTSKQLDLNQFQHILFLAKYDNESGSDLTPIGSTAIYPLGLYSKQYTSVSAVPKGAKVAVPNDGTNQARALQVLASAKLIVLKSGTPTLSAAPEDIDTSSSTVTVTPVAADQTARTLDDKTIAAAVINNDYVADTGLKATDAIAKDDPAAAASAPFVNIWVSRAADKDDPVYLELVKIAQTKPVEDALIEQSGGTGVIVHTSAADLQSALADVRTQLKG